MHPVLQRLKTQLKWTTREDARKMQDHLNAEKPNPSTEAPCSLLVRFAWFAPRTQTMKLQTACVIGCRHLNYHLIDISPRARAGLDFFVPQSILDIISIQQIFDRLGGSFWFSSQYSFR